MNWEARALLRSNERRVLHFDQDLVRPDQRCKIVPLCTALGLQHETNFRA